MSNNRRMEDYQGTKEKRVDEVRMGTQEAPVEEQLTLIDIPRPILCAELVAEGSPKRAWYRIMLLPLEGRGYLIRKESGCEGRRRPHTETWYRQDYGEAEEKYRQLMRQKTARARGRIYREVRHGER